MYKNKLTERFLSTFKKNDLAKELNIGENMMYLTSKQAREGGAQKTGQGEARTRSNRASWARIDSFWYTIRTTKSSESLRAGRWEDSSCSFERIMLVAAWRINCQPRRV